MNNISFLYFNEESILGLAVEKCNYEMVEALLKHKDIDVNNLHIVLKYIFNSIFIYFY